MPTLPAGVRHLPLGIANAYALEHAGRLTLIDAGVASSGKRIRALLTGAGQHVEDLRVILITHAHPDHVGALPDLLEGSGAEVWAHRLEAGVLRGDVPLSSVRPAPESLSWRGRQLSRGGSQPTAAVARELEDGEALDELYPGLQVVHLPGHAPGQVGFWLERERLLIGGDVLMHLPWGLTLPFRAFTYDWAEAKRSVHEVAGMGVRTLLLGHGAPLGNAAPVINRVAKRLG
jgi:glyoxylase-like metal-dependent hydrolase (beta-lactamase superfamily II)